MHPLYTAREMARTLRDDRIAASQIKEHMPVSELIETIGLTDEVLGRHLERGRSFHELVELLELDIDEVISHVVTHYPGRVKSALDDR